MGRIRAPHASGRGFFAGVAVVAAGVLVWQTATRARGLESGAELCMLAAAIAGLTAAALFYVHWHVGQNASVAWLVTATAAFAMQQLSWFTLLMNDQSSAAAQTAWAGAFQVLVSAGLGIVLLAGDRLPVRQDPLGVGIALGLAIIVVRILVFSAPLPVLSAAVYTGTVVSLVAVGAWNARRIAQSRLLPLDVRRRIALACLLLSVGQVAAMPAPTPAWVLVTSIVTNTAGAALVVATAATMARAAILDETTAVRALRGRLEAAQHDLHTDQAQLHEVRATLAGITAATDLIHGSDISAARREQLQEMTTAELRRLQRLVGARAASEPGPVELDAALRPVVVRHRTDGLPVVWSASGLVALARADDVAEIVNILLSNARRHAGRRPVTIVAAETGDRVEISVTDRGPGIHEEVRRRLFTWGAHGPDSPGEGVGLATARLLAGEFGAELRLAPTTGVGATFVLSLAAVQQPALQDGPR